MTPCGSPFPRVRSQSLATPAYEMQRLRRKEAQATAKCRRVGQRLALTCVNEGQSGGGEAQVLDEIIGPFTARPPPAACRAKRAAPRLIRAPRTRRRPRKSRWR